MCITFYVEVKPAVCVVCSYSIPVLEGMYQTTNWIGSRSAVEFSLKFKCSFMKINGDNNFRLRNGYVEDILYNAPVTDERIDWNRI